MSFLPDIEDGELKLPAEHKVYTPPPMPTGSKKEYDERLAELNNFGRKEVTEDFSDSPHI